MFKDYYKILDIIKNATSQEIKIAYKKQAIKWHPDKNRDKDTTQNMQDINEAYLILNDIEARKRFDVEYDFFNKQNTHFDENKQTNSDYQFNDETLEKWIIKARKQAINLAKRTLKEIGETTIIATEAAGKKMIELLITYSIIGIILLIIFRACS